MNLTTPLARSLQQYDDLSPQELDALAALPARGKSFRSREEFVREGDRPTQSCVLVRGMAVRVRTLRSGKRQVTDLHVPGDFVDLHSLFLKRMDHSVAALGDCEVAFIAHEPLRRLMEEYPHLSRLFSTMIAIDAAIDRSTITCLGARPDLDHMAYFLCELFTRLKARGLTEGNTLQFLATQAELGEMLGMSTVHVNRMLQDLRKLKLVEWQGSTITILDFAQLADRGEFRPRISEFVEGAALTLFGRHLRPSLQPVRLEI